MHLCLCGRGEDSSGCRELSSFWEELDELSVVFWGGRGANTDRMRAGNALDTPNKQPLSKDATAGQTKKQEV